MKFGIEIPTCTPGMMYPVPFATASDVVDTAIEAEQLGYQDADGNDHLSTMRFARDAWPTPPDYFEPLLTLAHLFVANTVHEMREQVRAFARHVLSAFPEPSACDERH